MSLLKAVAPGLAIAGDEGSKLSPLNDDNVVLQTLGKGSSQQPESLGPEDYASLIQQQADANRVNTTGPYGESTFSKDDDGRTTLTTELSPGVRRLFTQQLNNAGQDVSTGDVLGDSRPAYDASLARALNPEFFDDEVQNATIERTLNALEPNFEQQRNRTVQSLSDRGIPIGSEAYNDVVTNLDRDQNTARENAALSGVVAGNRAALDSRAQNFSELSNVINQGMLTNNQDFNQQFSNRAQGFNELASILGQQSAPNAQPLDVLGAANMVQNSNLAGQQRADNQKSSNTNAAAGLGSAWLAKGGAAAAASDRRLKHCITKIGQLTKDLAIYLYKYKWSDAWQVGLMSDEVRKVVPDAVMKVPGGYDFVDYRKVLWSI